MNNPWVLLVMIAAGFYVAKLWNDDRRRPHAQALPGATPAGGMAILIAVMGALLLLALETVGEQRLDLAKEQTKMTWLYAAYSVLAAPFLEELVFRGYLVIDRKGQKALWAGAIGASLIFALVHGYLVHWENGGVVLTLTIKGAFSTAVLFLFSLWLYTARFAPWNPTRSLLPCFVAHAAKNAGVVAVKAATGFMGAAW